MRCKAKRIPTMWNKTTPGKFSGRVMRNKSPKLLRTVGVGTYGVPLMRRKLDKLTESNCGCCCGGSGANGLVGRLVEGATGDGIDDDDGGQEEEEEEEEEDAAMVLLL